jgi:hypothetical protein
MISNKPRWQFVLPFTGSTYRNDIDVACVRVHRPNVWVLGQLSEYHNISHNIWRLAPLHNLSVPVNHSPQARVQA